MYSVLIKTKNKKLFLLSQEEMAIIFQQFRIVESERSVSNRFHHIVDSNPEYEHNALSTTLNSRLNIDITKLSAIRDKLEISIPGLKGNKNTYSRKSAEYFKLGDIVEFHVIPYYNVSSSHDEDSAERDIKETRVSDTDSNNNVVHVLLDKDFDILGMFHNTEIVELCDPKINDPVFTPEFPGENGCFCISQKNGHNEQKLIFTGSTFVESWNTVRIKHPKSILAVGGNRIDVGHIDKLITVSETD